MVNQTEAFPEDAEELYAIMHPLQLMEVEASDGYDVAGTIASSIENSSETVAVRYNEILLGVAGIVPASLLGGTASPWMLTSKYSEDHPRLVMKYTKAYVDKWSKEYDLLYSFIDNRYVKALRWAEWAGFTVYPAVPYGVNGELFNPIEIRR